MGNDVREARRAYLRFVEERFGSGHEEKYYQTTDRRFLGDEGFVAEVAAKSKDKEIRRKGPRVKFEGLLALVCKQHGLAEDMLTVPGGGRIGSKRDDSRCIWGVNRQTQ